MGLGLNQMAKRQVVCQGLKLPNTNYLDLHPTGAENLPFYPYREKTMLFFYQMLISLN